MQFGSLASLHLAGERARDAHGGLGAAIANARRLLARAVRQRPPPTGAVPAHERPAQSVQTQRGTPTTRSYSAATDELATAQRGDDPRSVKWNKSSGVSSVRRRLLRKAPNVRLRTYLQWWRGRYTAKLCVQMVHTLETLSNIKIGASVAVLRLRRRRSSSSPPRCNGLTREPIPLFPRETAPRTRRSSACAAFCTR